MALPFILAAAALLLGAFLGTRVEKIEILGIVLREKPFDTRGARVAAASAAVLCLIPAVVLAGVWPPGPTPDPSPSPGPSAAVASSTPVATATIDPTTSPTVKPTKSPPTQAPPTATPNPVKKWARDERDRLESLNIDLGAALGSTRSTTDGWDVQGFEKGILYRNSKDVVVSIRGPIYERWKNYLVVDEPAPGLGYPSRNQQIDAGGFEWQRFATGAIQCTPTGCFSVVEPVYANWRQHRAKIGYPKGEAVTGFLSSSHTDFESGTIDVNMQGEVTVCGANGEQLEGSGTLCGGAPPLAS